MRESSLAINLQIINIQNLQRKQKQMAHLKYGLDVRTESWKKKKLKMAQK